VNRSRFRRTWSRDLYKRTCSGKTIAWWMLEFAYAVRRRKN